ncbi:MAG: hypothetical protein ABEH77_01575, partial [Halobacteriaceae archaeon]
MVAVRLADDDRARVPFALVGVVLLVGSATVAATVGSPAPTATSAPTRAAEEATAVARTAIERAVSRAARRAARSPVVVPANTTAGRAINNSTPFRDYLRIRVYLAARRSLARATARVGDAEATVSLPNVSDTASLRAAKRRVRLRELDGERPRLAVTVRNVSVTVTRRGRVIERRRYAPTVAVETPVLALHRRTAAFERRLTRSPAEGGLAARVTAKLAALAWARGLAQYGGAPVANVVATRHLEVITIGALLDAQRRAFGRSDPAGRRAHDRAGLRAAADDLLAGSANAEWTEAVLGQVGGSVADTAIGIAGRAALDHTRTPLTVGVNRTADVAFMNTTDGALAAAIDGVYTAEARLRAESRVVERGTVGRTTPDGDGWRLARTATETTTGVEAVEAPPPQVSGEGHRLASFARAVTTRTRIIRTWRRGAQSVRTVAVRRTRRRVRIAVVGRHAVTPDAPDLAIDGAHSPGGPLDGTNFAGVRERAVRVLVERRGGADALARRVANGSVNTSGVTLDVPPPDGLREWVYRDLAGLRERVRALSVTVDRRTALTGSPTSRLLDATRHRRDDLLDAPATYPSVAAKARVAARAVYLDRVTARLEHRTRKERRTRDRLAAALARHNLSLSALLGALDPPPDEQGGDESPVAAVRGEPPYLTASAVGPRHTDAVGGAYHPLVARNRNLFATPHGDLGAAVAAELVPRDAGRAGLRAAGRALRAANATLRRRRNDTLRARRGRLRTAT